MKRQYSSDITREQFEEIRKQLEEARQERHPRKYDLYDTFCGILYFMKEQCAWKNIPSDYPKWQNVRHYYDIWLEPDENGVSLLDKVLRKLVASEQRRTHKAPLEDLTDYIAIIDYIHQDNQNSE